MSAIGDYVHLTYTGYKNGPNEGSGRPPFFDNYGASFFAKERRFQNWMKKQNSPVAKELEKETNKILSLLKKYKNGSISNKEKEYIDALLVDLWKELDTKYLTIDKYAAASAGLLEARGFIIGKYTGENGSSQTPQKNVINNINKNLQGLLNNTLENIFINAKNLTQDAQVLKDIEKEVKKSKQNIDNFIRNLQTECKTLDVSDFKNTSKILNSMFQNIAQTLKNSNDYNQLNIEEEINGIADALNAGTFANQYKGDISEALIAVIARRMTGIAGSAIEKAVVSGQERSQRGIDTSFFSGDIQWENALEGKRFKQPFGDFIVSADAVQDKVDVKIELSTGRKAYISAKNYSADSLKNRGVTNRSASFLTLIQNENDKDFINHYLNLNSVHGNWQTLRHSAEAINALIKQITIAKLITGYNTITGQQGKTMENANIFTVFNSSNYTVKYYDMDDVLTGLIRNDRYKAIKIPQYFYNANIKNVADYRMRISNLIKRLNVGVSYTLKEEDYTK